uniref:TFIIS N-terminal domain-containing protein n=1 Tax=Leersia perrieri TaxID=77586 RepID=A0A0D9WPC1_9ORYZ
MRSSIFRHGDEATDHPALSRDEFRDARSKIVEMLSDATDDGEEEEAEELRATLDEMMFLSLLTLEVVPLPPAKTLAGTDLARDVVGLTKHESGRVRGLAACVVRRWRASRPTSPRPRQRWRSYLRLWNMTSHHHPERSTGGCQGPKNDLPAAEKRPARASATPFRADDERALNAAKRRLREGYEEAEEAKRRCTVKVIEAPAMARQRQRKMHPILR